MPELTFDVPMTRRLVQETSIDLWSLVKPMLRFARGPRGGLYAGMLDDTLPAGATFKVIEPMDFYMRDQIVYRVRMKGRYLRPGTKLHREAQEALR